MALGNNNSAIYLKVSDGKIVRQFKTETPNSVVRITKTGKTVHEEFYDFVEGTITDIRTKENEYGKFWMVTLVDYHDGDLKYILEFNYSGGVANSFLRTLPNVDFSTPVQLKPKQTIDGDKKRTSLFINQSGKALKWAWTKENPGDMPQLKKIKVKGKEAWDDSDIMEFLEGYVASVIVPKLGQAVEVDTEEDF